MLAAKLARQFVIAFTCPHFHLVELFNSIGFFFFGVTADKKVQYNSDLLKHRRSNVHRK